MHAYLPSNKERIAILIVDGVDSSLRPWVTVGEALTHIPEPEDSPNIPNHEYSNYKLRFNGHLGHRYHSIPTIPLQR